MLEVKGLLDFPTGPSLKFHTSLGCSVLSMEREQHPGKTKNSMLLGTQELSSPLRKGNGCCFTEFPFHRMMCPRMSVCLSWGPEHCLGSHLQICFVCKKKGAAIKCQKDQCIRNFHLPCGQERGCLSQFFGEYK